LEDINEIMRLDMEAKDRELQTKRSITVIPQPETQNPTRKPNVKQIATHEYNSEMGVLPVHPMSLFTELADNSPWVDLTVRVIGGTCVSTVPMFRIVTVGDIKKGQTKIWDSRIADMTELLTYPNLHQTGIEFFKTIFENLGLYGNAYVQIIRNRDGSLNSLWTLPPETIYVIPYYDDRNIMHFGYVQNDIVGEPRIYLEEEIVHFKTTNPKSFVYGKPLFVSQLVNIATNLNAQKALNSWFELGMTAGAIFTQDADADVAQRNREFIKEMFTKPENFGRTMILEGDMKLIKDGNRFTDFDFKKLSDAGKDDCLIAAGVPLSIAGIRSDDGNSNLEVIKSEELAFYTNTLDVFQKIVFDKITHKLFRQILGWKELKIEAGAKTRFDMGNAIESINAISAYGIKPNEARKLLSMPLLDNEIAGNTLLIATNNGSSKFGDIVGIDPDTGAKVETIFEKAQKEQTDMKSGSGLGGKLKEVAEKKPKKVDKSA